MKKGGGSASRILRLKLDALKLSAEQNPGCADPIDLEGNVKLAKLFLLHILEENAERLMDRQVMRFSSTTLRNIVFKTLLRPCRCTRIYRGYYVWLV